MRLKDGGLVGIRFIIECECCSRTFTNVMEAEDHTLDHRDPRDVADYIHRKTCNSNHIDGCSYNDESWGQAGITKLRYLGRAGKILELSRKHGIDLRELLEVVV